MPARALLLFALLAGPLPAQPPAPGVFDELTPGPNDPEVRKLLIERYNTLHRVIDAMAKLTAADRRLAGELGASQAADDNRALIDARLALAADPAERVRVLEAAVARLKRHEEEAGDLAKKGFGSPVEAARFKIIRLEMEVRLAEGKAAPPARK